MNTAAEYEKLDLRGKISLYIHIPFCVRKCRYCDFLSFPGSCTEISEYLNALERQIREEGERVSSAGKTVDSVFIGGGTPTVLTEIQMEHLMESLGSAFRILPGAEITSECNPGTADGNKLTAFRNCGINRLSIGVQSFRDSELRLLGRIHTAQAAERCFEAARGAGFENISMDLISALPGQSTEEFMYSLQRAVELKPEHLSVYSLIIEEGTPFYERYGEGKDGEKDLPSEETERETAHRTAEFLSGNGYRQYEISNFAAEERMCLHNVGYWKGHEYLGLGLGASGFEEKVRRKNTSSMEAYCAGRFGPEETEIIGRAEAMEEFFILGYRMTEGVSEEKFFRTFGITPQSVYGKVLDRQEKLGLIRREKGRIFLTRYGTDVSNSVMVDYLDPVIDS